MPRPLRLLSFALLIALGLAGSRRALAQSVDDAGTPSPPSSTTLMPAPSVTVTTPPVPVPAPQRIVINPRQDQGSLATQGSQRPANVDGSVGENPRDVYGEDWWGKPRPTIEVHGYFRTRGWLFSNMTLGRNNPPGDAQSLWPQPLDNSYVQAGPAANGTTNVNLCGSSHNSPCSDKIQTSADLRLRLNPEIHLSDNLRILSQIDMLDNLVLGSTPDAFAMQPGSGTAANSSGYISAGYNAYAPLAVLSNTQGPPTANINSFQNSINVNRAWGEYMTPVGQLRFGRMPSQWGLGMVANAGDGLDSDYQTTVDRIMFITGVKSLDLYFGGAWDFVSSGTNSTNPYTVYGGEPYNNANLDNVREWVLFAAHRTNPDLTQRRLRHGDFVLNGGIYAVYRSEQLDLTPPNTPNTQPTNDTNPVPATPLNNGGFVYRGAWAFIPDLWVQLLYRKLRIEGEFATIWGQIGATPQEQVKPTLVREFGLVTQTEYQALRDKLHLNFGFGWASGDPWAPALNPGQNGLQPEGNTFGPISTFRFHPDYRVDLIFFRQILTRVEGAYYFRPSVDYDFVRRPDGQKFGAGAAVIWSRASVPVEAPGREADLGLESDFSVYYQSSDGSLNDDPTKIGGFFAMVQYGAFFPLAGLNYPAGTTGAPSLTTAQTARLFLGVVF